MKFARPHLFYILVFTLILWGYESIADHYVIGNADGILHFLPQNSGEFLRRLGVLIIFGFGIFLASSKKINSKLNSGFIQNKKNVSKHNLNDVKLHQSAVDLEESNKRLRESEAMLRAVFDNIQDLYYRTDANGIILVGTPYVKEILGYTRDELIGTNLANLYLNPSDRGIFLQMLQKAGGRVRNVEMPLRHKNGSTVIVSTNAQFIYDAKGNVAGVEGSVRDVTELKHAEEDLKKYAADLEESNKMKELYIDILSHDILNPVCAIISVVDLFPAIERNKFEIELLDIISRSAQNIEDIINLVRRYSRISSQDEISKKRICIDEMVKTILEKISCNLRNDTSLIKYTGTPDLIIYANELIYDVVENLISNAIKYGQSSEGDVITIEADEEQNQTVISVRDRGKGVPDEYKENIFRRFERLEMEHAKGAGLGLAICSRIVKLHNGNIWVEDNPEGGSVFKFSIPKSLL